MPWIQGSESMTCSKVGIEVDSLGQELIAGLFYNSNQMALPAAFNNIGDLHYYQGVLLVEVALTLLFYLILKIIHYVKWGHQEDQKGEEGADNSKKEPEGEAEEESKKWDQKAWNVYFPILFSLHIGAIALIILYIPYVFAVVMGFLHFVCFVVLVILNICIKDAEPGNGARTKGTRVVWLIMCVINILLIVGGLTGVEKVYP